MNSLQSRWPQTESETRPWTRWWWPGSAVDKDTLTRLLETYHQAGIGGVEITSIYGVKGAQDRNISYLSDEWLDMVRHTISECDRLGMKVDLPPGSGWRIGGSYMPEELGAAQLDIEKNDTESEVTLTIRPSGERIKRPGPGGEGLAFNPFSRNSIDAAINHFTPAFKDLGIRAQFHDSWEYNSDAFPEMFEAFNEKYGYRLEDHAAELAGDGDPERVSRIRYDVRSLLADRALEEFIMPWSEWCRSLGQLSRNQAHGSPGNVLDLYAAVDIPETEVFRSVTPDTPLDSKLASSAAHVAGRKLASSETGTWLKEHFHVRLSDMKELLDNLFVAGINHHVYHGTAYSPPETPWPGWLFYASTQINPQNPFWHDIGTLNEYVTRCQSILQAGQPDNDLLVYLPVHEVFHKTENKLAEKLVIDGQWLRQLPCMETFRMLWNRGYAFDYISDRQIAELKKEDQKLAAPGGTYTALLVPPCKFMPVKTLRILLELQKRGAAILFAPESPADIPGLHHLEKRRNAFEELKQNITTSADIENALTQTGICRETMMDIPGLMCIRRKHESGRDCFIVNQSGTAVDQWIVPASDFQSALILDPMTGSVGSADMRTAASGNTEARIQLDPGASLVLRLSETPEKEPTWPYIELAGPAEEIGGTWRISFLKGGPQLPPDAERETLCSWTELGEAAESFAGTALYRIAFDAPDGHDAFLLDLGEVHASARVRLNGKPVQTLIGPSFRTVLCGVQPTDNELEIEVTSLAANRIRDLDRRGEEWKIFEDINIVNREYKPFDASGWELMPAGLSGPVTLTPLGEKTVDSR